MLTLSLVILESLKRLSTDDLEDDGSGTLSVSDCSIGDPRTSSDVPNYQLLTSSVCDSDWENSAGSSDQVDSAGDDDMKDYEF